jgi:hypothetical protein
MTRSYDDVFVNAGFLLLGAAVLPVLALVVAATAVVWAPYMVIRAFVSRGLADLLLTVVLGAFFVALVAYYLVVVANQVRAVLP